MSASLCLLVHSNSKVGKTWLADTAPGPRLVIDAEGGVKWTKSTKTKWADARVAPPTTREDGTPLGSEDTVVLRVMSFKDLQLAEQWLNAGQHVFRSVILDSVTEAQYKAQQAITANAMQIQDWGTLLRDMLKVCVSFRDLPDHATNPVECIVFVTGSKPGKDGTIVPDLQGQLERKLPYIADVIGYLFTVHDPSTQTLRRGMLIQPTGPQLAGDRTDVLSRHFGTTIPDPTIPTMMEVLNAV